MNFFQIKPQYYVNSFFCKTQNFNLRLISEYVGFLNKIVCLIYGKMN
jgi:hypothetical protein